jgi:hypothetical protein
VIAFKRLGWGGAIGLVAATLLIVFTFFQWYGRPHSGPNQLLIDYWLLGGGTAWQSLAVVPLLVVLTAAIVALGVSLLRLGGSRWRPAIRLGAFMLFFGVLAVIVILAGINWPPETQPIQRVPIEQSAEAGIYLALVAALGIIFGGWLTMRAEGT